MRRATACLSACFVGAQISIHALLAESDCQWRRSVKLFHQFLSTLSLRRATPKGGDNEGKSQDFYPRSPCGERLACMTHMQKFCEYFYPRSPCGERPIVSSVADRSAPISIHALLAESDVRGFDEAKGGRDFYPRSPCGERPLASSACRRRHYFYPRSPCGERQLL